MAESELNKSEEATPFKLEQARRKGNLARGLDLGFFSSLGAFLLLLTIAGSGIGLALVNFMRTSLGRFDNALEPTQALAQAGEGWALLLGIMAKVAAAILIVVIPLEIVQLRGISFSAFPLKPDFKRLNPAQGFKRVFSLRTLKEAAKSIIKLIVYCSISYIAIHGAWKRLQSDMGGGREFAILLWSEVIKMLALFVVAALFIAVIDQLLARREFKKQMRMSRSEVTREAKDREGEPRLKAKRKQLHAEFRKQSAGIGQLAGSDLLLVNPEHFAVALAYDGSAMAAPKVRAKGRNLIAQELKRQARNLAIPIISDPPLARALYRSAQVGEEIGGRHYREVANHYARLRSRTELDS